MGENSDHSGPLLPLCGIQGCRIREHDCFLWNQPQKVNVFKTNPFIHCLQPTSLPSFSLCDTTMVFLRPRLESFVIFFNTYFFEKESL